MTITDYAICSHMNSIHKKINGHNG